MIEYRNGLEALPAYDVAERDWTIKIDANECNFNLPPPVAERVMNRLSCIAFNRYPAGEMADLKELIAANFALRPENVLIGNGSSEILEKLFFAFGGAGHAIVFPVPSFSMYSIYAKISESAAVLVELEADYTLDPVKMVQVAKDSAANLVVLCSPNNPTGNEIPLRDIEYIAAQVDCPLVVDEAYVEFCGRSAAGLLKLYPNLIIARTFSKAYGLAAARAGYMLAAAPITAMIARAYMPYSVNTMTLAVAGVVYQMRDEFVPRIQMFVAERRRMEEALRTLPQFTVYPSAANFLLVHCPQAAALHVFLEECDIGVRGFGNAPRLKNCLRFSIGTREENDCWLRAVRSFVERG